MQNIKKLLFLVGFFAVSVQITAQNLENGIWKLESSVVFYNSDSTEFFNLGASNNIYDLSEISYNFNSDGTYEGTSITGSQFEGVWSLDDSVIELDSINGDFSSLSQTSFQISTPFTIVDTLGNTFEAESILRFYDFTVTSTRRVENNNSIKVYPNPFKSEIVISLTDLKDMVSEISIVNSLGQIIFSAKYSQISTNDNVVINTDDFERGHYILIIKGNKWLTNKKVIKIE